MSKHGQTKYKLMMLTKHNRDGSYATQEARKNALLRFATDIKDKYPKLNPESLGMRHVNYAIEQWRSRDLSPATIKNNLSHLRWLEDKVGKAGMIPSNDELGIEHREYVTNEDNSQELTPELLDQIEDERTRLSVELADQFGLRREEAMKFKVAAADQGDRLKLHASWCKGGREREIPIRTEAQRELIDRIHRYVGNESLIPSHEQYVDQMRRFEHETRKADIKPHGLRHAYAQKRYQELTGRDAPAKGGISRSELSQEEREKDNQARLTISEELGHSRVAIVANYLGT